MNLEELAFVNQQLAAMLRTGIPLEGSLRQLCAEMRRGRLRSELGKLEADLTQGTPLREALSARQFPPFYRHMIAAGVQGNDLPGILTLLADYYQRAHFTWTRLKGLMVYLLLVLLTALALSVFLATTLSTVLGNMPEYFANARPGLMLNQSLLWAPAMVLALASAGLILVLLVPGLRRSLRWRLPGFKEDSLAWLASAMSLMLKGGTTLPDALALLGAVEAKSEVGWELENWRVRLSEGVAKIRPPAGDGDFLIPPLFYWLVESGGDDLPEGFRRAAEIYHARAVHRTELLLYAALPVSVLMLGFLIVAQVLPLIRLMVASGGLIDTLGGF